MGAGYIQPTREMCVYLSRTGIAPPHIWVDSTGRTRARWLTAEHPGGRLGGEGVDALSGRPTPCSCMVMGGEWAAASVVVDGEDGWAG